MATHKREVQKKATPEAQLAFDSLVLNKPIDWTKVDLKEGRSNLSHVRVPASNVMTEEKITSFNLQKIDAKRIKSQRISDIDFTGAYLRHLRLYDVTLVNCVFNNTNCEDWRVWNSDFINCDFTGVSFRESSLGGEDQKPNTYTNCNFSKCDFIKIGFFIAIFKNCLFDSSKINNVDFYGTVFENCIFSGLLNDARFYDKNPFQKGTELYERGFPVNKMKNVDFTRAKFKFVTFKGLDLNRVRWPEDPMHLIVDNWPQTLDAIIQKLEFKRKDPIKNKLYNYCLIKKKNAGHNQEVGIISLYDFNDDERDFIKNELHKPTIVT